MFARREWFGEDVRGVLECWDVMKFYRSRVDLMSRVVEMDIDMFCSIIVYVVVRE